MKIYDVVVWGSSTQYDRYAKAFEHEMLKGNIAVKAIIFNEEGVGKFVNGIPVVPIDEILNISYDYLIDMNETEPQTVLKILSLLQIPREKVIPARVFLIPVFDFGRWAKVKESRISIISDNCWGGLTYHSLGLQFNSPFINMFSSEESYIKLLENFEYYMSQPLELLGEQWEEGLKWNYPVMGWGDVQLHFNHYNSEESAVSSWNRRIERMNYENLLVEMRIYSKEALDRFLALPFRYKVALTLLDCDEPNVISLGRYNYYSQKFTNETFWAFINNMASIKGNECKVYDILKLLNHEENYRRCF